jgi:hypothetical protein
MEDAVAEALRAISDNFNDLGQEGRIILAGEIPVIVTLDDGRTHRSTIMVHWTEHGIEIANSEEQGRRLASEIDGVRRD